MKNPAGLVDGPVNGSKRLRRGRLCLGRHTHHGPGGRDGHGRSAAASESALPTRTSRSAGP